MRRAHRCCLVAMVALLVAVTGSHPRAATSRATIATRQHRCALRTTHSYRSAGSRDRLGRV
ncbi:hypothetical protein MAHJHV51_47350 [Mycobacterium avium subsp. hominissuis]